MAFHGAGPCHNDNPVCTHHHIADFNLGILGFKLPADKFISGFNGSGINNAIHLFEFRKAGLGFADNTNNGSSGIDNFPRDARFSCQPFGDGVLPGLGNTTFKYKNH